MFRLVLFLNFAFMTRKHFIVHLCSNLLIGKDMWTCHLPFVIGFCWSCHICDENFTLIWHFLCQNVYGMTDGEDWRRGERGYIKCTIYKPVLQYSKKKLKCNFWDVEHCFPKRIKRTCFNDFCLKWNSFEVTKKTQKKYFKNVDFRPWSSMSIIIIIDFLNRLFL